MRVVDDVGVDPHDVVVVDFALEGFLGGGAILITLKAVVSDVVDVGGGGVDVEGVDVVLITSEKELGPGDQGAVGEVGAGVAEDNSLHNF